jgi:hypothetical protein
MERCETRRAEEGITTKKTGRQKFLFMEEKYA